MVEEGAARFSPDRRFGCWQVCTIVTFRAGFARSHMRVDISGVHPFFVSDWPRGSIPRRAYPNHVFAIYYTEVAYD